MIITPVLISGMTCGHCVSAVSEELGKLDGVAGVEVDLVAAGDSRVIVTSSSALSPVAVREAVDEGGYAVVEEPR